jgi:hypothetical protein
MATPLYRYFAPALFTASRNTGARRIGAAAFPAHCFHRRSGFAGMAVSSPQLLCRHGGYFTVTFTLAYTPFCA